MVPGPHPLAFHLWGLPLLLYSIPHIIFHVPCTFQSPKGTKTSLLTASYDSKSEGGGRPCPLGLLVCKYRLGLH